MFNMGVTEMILLGVIALVVIGPRQLPEVARTVARMLNELKRATGDLTDTFMDVRNQANRTFEETRRIVDEALQPEGHKEKHSYAPEASELVSDTLAPDTPKPESAPAAESVAKAKPSGSPDGDPRG